jgi:vacuolar-type H+-ATPase subunit I/STV1
MKPKKSAGRPVAGVEKKQRYQVVLEPSVAENVRRNGGDNLSHGLSKLPQVNARLRSVKDKYEATLKAIAETTTDQKARKASLDALGEGYRILSEFL